MSADPVRPAFLSRLRAPHVHLLTATVLLIVILAVGPGGALQQVANLVFAVWMAAALWAAGAPRRDFWILLALGWAPAILELLIPAAGAPLGVSLVKQALWAGFSFYLAYRVFLLLFFSRTVTHHELAGAVTAYLQVGIGFSDVFQFMFLRNPDSLSFGYLGADGVANYGDLLYFSFVTLATLGYGDVAPLTAEVRLLAGAEAIMGLLYMAIMVARLVSLHAMAGRDVVSRTRETDGPPHDRAAR